MRRYTATELMNRTGDVLDAASREAVAIARHGTPRFVVMSLERYERLIGRGARRAVRVQDLADPEADELAAAPERGAPPSPEAAAIDRVFGCLARPGQPPVSIEAMDAAVLAMAARGGEEADDGSAGAR